MDLKDTTKQDGQSHQSTSAEDITEAMIEHVVGIAELSDASAIFVYVDALQEKALPLPDRLASKEFELPRGLGARHHSAAGITSVADCIAVTVSESTGTVTVFRGGQIVTEIERRRSIGAKTPEEKSQENFVDE